MAKRTRTLLVALTFALSGVAPTGQAVMAAPADPALALSVPINVLATSPVKISAVATNLTPGNVTFLYQPVQPGMTSPTGNWTQLGNVDTNPDDGWTADWPPADLSTGDYWVQAVADQKTTPTAAAPVEVHVGNAYHLDGDVEISGQPGPSYTVTVQGQGINQVITFGQPVADLPGVGKFQLVQAMDQNNNAIPGHLHFYMDVPEGTYTVTATDGTKIVSVQVVTSSATSQDLGYGVYFMQQVPNLSLVPLALHLAGGAVAKNPFTLKATAPQGASQVSFAEQPKVGDQPDAQSWNPAGGQAVLGQDGWSTSWTPMDAGNYWVKVAALDANNQPLQAVESLTVAERPGAVLSIPAGLAKVGQLQPVPLTANSPTDWFHATKAEFFYQQKPVWAIDPDPNAWHSTGSGMLDANTGTWSGGWTPPRNGEFWLRVILTDDAGITAESAPAVMGAEGRAAVAPSGSPVAGQPVTLQGSTSDSDLAVTSADFYWQAAVEGQDAPGINWTHIGVQDQSSDGGWTVDWTPPNGGNYWLRVRLAGTTAGVADTASGATSVIVGAGAVNNNPPAATLTLPQDPPVEDQTVTLSASVADTNFAVTSAEFFYQPKVDGQNAGSTWNQIGQTDATGPAWTADWTPTDPGSYWVKAVLSDANGNKAEDVQWTTVGAANVNPNPPSVSFADADADHIYFGGNSLGVTVTSLPITDGTNVRVQLGTKDNLGNFISAPVLPGMTSDSSTGATLWYLDGTYANGQLSIAGTVNTAPDELAGRQLFIQVLSADGSQTLLPAMPITPQVLVGQPQRPALWGLQVAPAGFTASPAAQGTANLYNTEQAMAFSNQVGAIQFASGINLVDHHPVNLSIQLNNGMVDANVGQPDLPQSVSSIQVPGAKQKFAIPAETPDADVVSYLQVQVIGPNGTLPDTDLGTYVDTANIAYDGTTDTLTVPVKQWGNHVVIQKKASQQQQGVMLNGLPPNSGWTSAIAVTAVGFKHQLQLTDPVTVEVQQNGTAVTGAVSASPVPAVQAVPNGGGYQVAFQLEPGLPEGDYTVKFGFGDGVTPETATFHLNPVDTGTQQGGVYLDPGQFSVDYQGTKTVTATHLQHLPATKSDVTVVLKTDNGMDQEGQLISDGIVTDSVDVTTDANTGLVNGVTFQLKAGLPAGNYTVWFTVGANPPESAHLQVLPVGVQLDQSFLRAGWPTPMTVSFWNFKTPPQPGDALTAVLKDSGGNEVKDAISNAEFQAGTDVRASVTLAVGLQPGTYTATFTYGQVEEHASFKIQPQFPILSVVNDLGAEPVDVVETGYTQALHLRASNLGLSASDQPTVSLQDLHTQILVTGAITDNVTVSTIDGEPVVDFYLSTSVAPGNYNVVIARNTTDDHPSMIQLDVRVHPNVTITVKDGANLVANANLELLPAGADPETAQRIDAPTDANGVAYFALTPGASYVVNGYGTDGHFTPMNFQITAPAQGAADAAFEVATNVQITVKDGANVVPSAGVSVRKASADPTAPGIYVQTDANGLARLGLAPGAYVIEGYGLNETTFVSLDQHFTVPESGSVSVTAWANVHLTVKDSFGTVLKDLGVGVVPDDGNGKPAGMDQMRHGGVGADGVVRMYLPAGTWYVVGVQEKEGNMRPLVNPSQFTVTGDQSFSGTVVVPSANVVVTVVDQNNHPVSGVTVEFRLANASPDDTAQSAWATTGMTGNAGITLAPKAAYVITGVHSPGGQLELGTQFTVPETGIYTTTVTFYTNVQATLYDEDGKAYPNAWVRIVPATPDPNLKDGGSIYTNTDADGAIRLSLKPGDYVVTEVGSDGRHVTTNLPFTVAQDTGFSGSLNLTMPSVKFVVTGDGGLFVDGGMIQLKKVDAGPTDYPIWVPIGKDGIARIDLPHNTSYILVDVGTRSGVTSIRQRIDLPASGQTVVPVSVATNIQSLVLDEGGNPLIRSGVTIKPDDANGSPVTDWTLAIFAGTDDSGKLHLNLKPGKYHLVEINNPDRHIVTDIKFEVTTGIFGDNLQVPRPNVTVTVKDGVNPVPMAMVQIRPADARPEDGSKSVWTQTDQQGVARLQLTPGLYQVVDIGTPKGVTPVNKQFTAPDLTVDPNRATEDVRVFLDANVVATVLDEHDVPMALTMVTIKPDDGNGHPVMDWNNAFHVGTNTAGTFSLNLPAGPYHVVELGNPMRHIRVDLPFQVDGTTGFHSTVSLPKPNLRVRVTDGAGPVVRAWVQIRPADARPDQWDKTIGAETDRDGWVGYLLPANASYVLVGVGTPNGFTPVNKPLATPPDSDGTPKEFEVSLATNVRAVVKDENGVAFVRAGVVLRRDNAGQPDPAPENAVFTGTNEIGAITVNLDPGVWHLTEIGTPNRHINTDIPFEVTATADYTSDLKLPSPNVTVTVTGNAGPVARAWLQFRPAGARPDEWQKTIWTGTDNNGVAALRLPAGAQYTLVDVGTPQGIIPVGKAITVPADGSALSVPVSLTTNVQSVLRDETGAAVSNAWLTIQPDQNGQPATDYQKAKFVGTNMQGQFSLNLDPGTYHLVEVGSPQRHLRTDVTFVVPDQGSFTSDLALPQANFRVTVTNGAAPVARAWVQIRPANASPDQWDKSIGVDTDANGVAQLRLNPGQEYVLWDIGTPQGVTRVNKRFTVPATSLTVNLASAAQVTLLDDSAQHAPISNAWVSIQPDDGGQPAQGPDRALFTGTNANGTFSMNLSDGVYHVVEIGTPDRHVRTDLTFSVTGGVASTDTLTLPSPNLKVAVTRNSAPVAHAWVQLRPASARPDEPDKSVWAETDALGVAQFILPTGTQYTLIDVGTPQGVTPVGIPVTAPADQVAVSLDANVQAPLQDEQGQALANAWVTVRPEDQNGNVITSPERALFAKAGGDGVISLNLEPNHRYHVVEVGTQQRVIRTDIVLNVGAGQFTDPIRLPAANTTASVVRGGAEVGYAKVAVAPAAADPAAPDYWSKVIWLEANEHGVVDMTLPAGNYVIRDVETPTRRYTLAAPVQFTAPAGTSIQINLPTE